jgi:hypothetical protein
VKKPRLLIASGMVVAVLTLTAIASRGSATTAQDPTEARLSDLETRVAAQEASIIRLGPQAAGLRERIDLLEEGSPPRTEEPADAGDPAPAADGLALRFEGSADTVTDPFIVREGTVRFDARYTGSSNFAVWIYGPDGSQDLVFNEIGPYEGSQVVPVAGADGVAIDLRAGEAFLEVTGSDGSWRIDVSQ